MEPPTLSRILTALLLLGCAGLGAYGTFGSGYQSGLFAALTKGVGADVKPRNKHFPGGPRPYKLSYTGIAAVDDQLAILIAFFTVLLDAPGQSVETVWTVRWLMTQFVGGWVLLVVEGLRRGNRGRVVSWTGTLGMIFQNITYTVSVPIYLIIHLFTSPMSSPGVTQDALTVDTQDLFLLPFSITGSFAIPSIMMFLPSPAVISATAHYTWQAIWQIFPATQSLTHRLTKHLTAPLNFKPSHPRQHDDIYRLLATLTFLPQTVLLALAVTPPSLVSHAGTKALLAQFTFTSTFVPYLPHTVPQGSTKPEALVVAAKTFLQYDMYCGGLALLVWAVYVTVGTRNSADAGRELVRVLPKVVGWTVLGGPAGAAGMLLWERDAKAAVVGEKAPVVPAKPEGYVFAQVK